MSSDLLFSILPRQGTVPIAHDKLKVEKVTKESALRELTDKEQELHLEEREARQQQQSLNKKKSSQDDEEQTHDSKTDDETSVNDDSDNSDKDSGFKHLDIYV
jgi:hypothetical protein